jgi:predicted GTPase
MGYSREQIGDLERTINGAECDLVLFATPIQLPRILSISRPSMRVRYEYRDHGEPTLKEVLLKRLNFLTG